MRLAVAELNLLQNRSYTEVEQAISRFPKGMEALYDRMATSIAQGTPNDNIMATKILQSVNCAYRPLTFVEMAQVLGEHHADQNHLHSSILAVCHGFILVVASSNYEDGNVPRISMIHHTAREYLLSSDTRPFKVDLRAAHTQMFKSCMECLMSSDLKDMVREKKSVEFLNYAACFWSRHLFSLSADSQVDTILTEFLTSKRSNKEWVLIWINYLAANNQLRVLTKASRQLLGYASKLKARSEGQHENGTQSLELRAILDSWAVDLIKIAGKWGMVLLRNPRLIYKSIPAFSPRSTPIFQQFGQAQTRNLAISGPPGMMEKWDDSLGRMTFGIRTQATAVASAGHHIAILAPEGKAFVYDASTFEQPTYGFIDHQERISKMAMNTRGTLVATCGWDTTNIWELHSGLCINSAQNPDGGPRPFTMIFTDDDNTLLVGFDDSKVRSLDLRHSSPTWEDFAVFEEKEISGHILNVPNSMVLNKDGTRLAVGYRGHPLSAWKLRRGKNPIHSGLCWRRGRSKKLRGEVEDMVWHPRFKLLLGVYVDGIVFKWRPGFSDSVSKNPRWEPKEIATGASKIAISRDGDLFVTGDPRGAIKIYTTIGFHLLYHLASEDMIGGITFSPDMRRLYDTRGYYASAWEPTALIRWAEQMRTTTDSFESKSETSTGETSVVSVNYSQTVDSITVVATPASRHSLYCTATVAGGVYLHHTQRGKLADIRVAEGLFGIDKMVFSRDSKYVCFTDSVKTLFIASIDFNEKTFATEVETKAEISLSQIVKGSILDLLFHHDSTHVLIQGSTSIRTISLTTFSVERSTDLDPAMENARWIPQPGDKAKILGISASNAELLTWNLEKLHSWTLTPRRTLSDWGFGDPTIEGKIDRIFPTSNGKHILVQVLPPSGQTFQTKTFFYIESSSLTTSLTPPNQPSIITPTILPQEMTSQIIHAHGFVSSNKLLYISKTYSINYWQIEFNQIGHDHPNIITHSGLGSDATIIPSRGLSNLNISSTPPPDITVTAPIKGAASEQERQSFVGRQSYMIKEIFPLPGDWISQDALAVSTLWGKERSFLCPRNGEVMLVRSPELRVV